MKMKQVCEMTGLTDRAVRYYIEENLLLPSYTENYLGRRTFRFTQTDIEELNNIVILRKFGFSVNEIRAMTQNPDNIRDTVNALQKRKQNMLNEEQLLLEKLLSLNAEELCNVQELAQHLALPVIDKTVPREDAKPNIIKAILQAMKQTALFILTMLPFLFSFVGFVLLRFEYEYPKMWSVSAIMSLVCLLPSCALFVLPKVKMRFQTKRIWKRVLVCICILCIPFSFPGNLCMYPYSETNDIRNYRKLDADCLANRFDVYQELFPTWANYFTADGTYLDAYYHYYYYEGFDYTFDIYAEWPLSNEAFDKEVERATKVLHSYVNDAYALEILQKGNYSCYFLYSKYQSHHIFEKETNSYCYFIFAYDETNNRVRYLVCDSLENGADQPYYLSLDWD